MYQVLARTWRSQRFSEVIGQRHVTQTLQNAIRLNRIGHGYIFSGQRGVGKTTVARLLAKALNCHQGPAPEPCGECDSCREITAGRSVDVIEIDAASNRGIDAVRELRENARYAPARDRYKVFIIDEAHQITPEGFNALLKTLEEPPSHVIFLLATTEVHQFPDTILSRCQHFAFHAAGFADILGHLEKICAAEGVAADAEALTALAAAAEGSLRDALSKLEQAMAAFGASLEGPAVRRLLGAAPAQLVEEVFLAVRDRKRGRTLELVEQLVQEGYSLTHFCAQLVRTVRNLLVIRVAGPQRGLLESSAEESERLAALAENFPEETLMRFLEILLQLNQELRFSMEPRFQMELGLLKLVDAERLVAIEELLARVEPQNAPGLPPRSSPPKPATPGPSPGAGPAPSPERGGLSPFEQDRLRKSRKAEPAPEGEGSPEQSRRSAETTIAMGGEKNPLDSSLTHAVILSEAKDPHSPAFATPADSSGRKGFGPQNDSQAEAVLIREVLRRIEESSKFLLASVLSKARHWEFADSEVKIQLAENGIAKVLPDSDRQFLGQLLSEILSRRVKVIWSSETGGSHASARPATPTGQSEKDPATGAPSIESRVRSDPEILEFEKVFGTAVTAIRERKE